MVAAENQSFDSQPMLDGFAPIEGIDTPIDPTTQAETQAQMVAAGERRGPAETRISPAYLNLGGGTSDTNTSEFPKQFNPKHKQRQAGHVRDVEPRDSDLDPEWTGPSPELTDDERAALNRHIPVARAMIARATAGPRYDYLQQFPVSQQQAILRARSERRGRA